MYGVGESKIGVLVCLNQRGLPPHALWVFRFPPYAIAYPFSSKHFLDLSTPSSLLPSWKFFIISSRAIRWMMTIIHLCYPFKYRFYLPKARRSHSPASLSKPDCTGTTNCIISAVASLPELSISRTKISLQGKM